ncbi:MAG: NADH dehydrogenase (quinone) subunit D [Acidobacteriota bacterium]
MADEVKEIPTERMVINFGPSHPATHGVFRNILELDGERILDAEVEIGFLHSGFEKLGEHRTYNQFITIADRMNYLSPLCNDVGYVLAVEKLLGIEVPPRCQYIRAIMCELNRIADHLVSVGMHAVDIGAMTVFLYAYKQREIIYDILEFVTGSRMNNSYPRVGGLVSDVPEGFEEKMKDFADHFLPTVDDIERLLTRNRIWVDRNKGIGAITPEEAISWGLTGPCLRAAGVDWDIRKAEPYSSYDHFDFEIPVGVRGDSYDRYLVRMEEMRQSNRIIQQAIANLPGGEVNVDDPKIILPPKERVYHSIEGLIHHFKLIMDEHGFQTPKGEIYSATEVPNGELGFFIVSDGTNKPYRIHVRAPSFINYSVFPQLVKGHMISDVVAVISSLNIIAGELDR